MLGAFIAVLCWSFGSIATCRAARRAGAGAANLVRVVLALVLLEIWTLIAGAGDGLGIPGAVGWLLLSGAVGLGAGDFAMMAAYRRIGPRLGVLILLCLSIPLTGLLEWTWLGTAMSVKEMLLAGAILAGVGVAMLAARARRRLVDVSRREHLLGLVWAVGSAIAQAVATVASRVAYAVAVDQGVSFTAPGATLARMVGAVPLALVLLPLLRAERGAGAPPLRVAVRGALPAIAVATLLGPVLGLAAYQWALVDHGGALVQSITALVPVAVIPIAWLFEHDRPSWKEIAGGICATAAAVALAWG